MDRERHILGERSSELALLLWERGVGGIRIPATPGMTMSLESSWRPCELDRLDSQALQVEGGGSGRLGHGPDSVRVDSDLLFNERGRGNRQGQK